MKKYFIIIIFLSVLATWPFFNKGFFESHDGEWMVIRFSAFHQTLAAGQFPVRFVDRLNNNYGYPVFNFLYPLPFYLSEFPKLIGFGFVDSIKITFIISTIISSTAMFWALSQQYSKYASLAGGIVYLFIPYRFLDLYVRGSLGENVAFAVAPFILGAIYKISNGRKIFLPILAISSGMLIVSHNVIAVLFMPLFILIAMIKIKEERLKTTIAFLIGFLVAAFYWIPALLDLKFVKFSQIKISTISDHFSSLHKLIVPSWGYGIVPNGETGFSTQIGLVSLSIFTISILLIAKAKKRDVIVSILLVVFALSIILNMNASQYFWQNIPYVDVIQFPWRLLSIIVLSSAILTGFVVDSTKNKKIIALVIIAVTIISTMIYAKPINFVNRGEGFYSTNEATTTVKDEYMPIWVKQPTEGRANEKIILNQGEISNKKITPTSYRATLSANDGANVLVNTIYFPGHEVIIDGNTAEINYDNPQGLINFALPKGTHEVIIKYGKTPVHFISELISLMTILGTGSYLFYLWRKQNS